MTNVRMTGAELELATSGGRLPSEILADLQARGSSAAMDEAFARDIATAIEFYRQPWTPPSWD